MSRTYYSYKRALTFAQDLWAKGIKATIWGGRDAAGQTTYTVEW